MAKRFSFGILAEVVIINEADKKEIIEDIIVGLDKTNQGRYRLILAEGSIDELESAPDDEAEDYSAEVEEAAAEAVAYTPPADQEPLSDDCETCPYLTPCTMIYVKKGALLPDGGECPASLRQLHAAVDNAKDFIACWRQKEGCTVARDIVCDFECHACEHRPKEAVTP